MAAYLLRAKKIDLLAVIKELNLETPENTTKIKLVDLIVKSDGYDEELIKNLLAGVVEERQESEKKQIEAEKRDLEWKKLKAGTISKNEQESANSGKGLDIFKLMAKYNNEEEISIFLNLFERQMTRIGIIKENWMTYLLGLLPLDIVNLIGREKDELADNYNHIKQLLLKRFKLSPEQFRQKFFFHRKENNTTWKDHSFELNNFLEEWLTGLGILTYENLKELLVIDQIRRKLPTDVKEHFVDEMPKFTKIDELVEKLDNYEAVRYNVRKNTEGKNLIDNRKRFSQNQENKNNHKNYNVSQNSRYERNNTFIRNDPIPFKTKCFYCNTFATHKSSFCPYKKEGPICYTCKSPGHFKKDCILNSTKNVHTTINNSNPSDKITKTIEINGKQVDALIDSGSDVTMINYNFYKTLGSPNLNENDAKLNGIGGKEITPIGFFNAPLSVDNNKINCDIYVLEDLSYKMILGNNCLSKFNFEMSDEGLKVTGKRKFLKNYKVNLITLVPTKSANPVENSNHINKGRLRLKSSNCGGQVNHLSITEALSQRICRAKEESLSCLYSKEKILAPENKAVDSFENNFVYLAKVANSINVKEIELSHITNRAMKKELSSLIENYQPKKTKNIEMKHVDALSRNTVLMLTRSYDEITTKLAKAQNEDEHIQILKTLIDGNKNKYYFIREKIVYKFENGRDLIVVPENMQKEIIREIHNRGHYALAKTKAMVEQEFYIPNLTKQIEIVINNCVECILCNRKKGKGEGLLNPIPKQNLPLQTYHIDHLGPMPSTSKNYNYIFTVIDAFTKFVWFYPVKTTSAKEVISKLKIQQATFGNPVRIISDRGAAFTSSDFKKYMEEENIEHVLITTGIPRGNGQVERVQETLIPILAKLSIEDPTKWFKHVAAVQRIINSTFSRSTSYTPFELLTGVKIKNKEDIKIREILEEECENAFVRERETNREIAKQNILKIQEQNRKDFNRKRKKARNYKIGELVAIQKTQFSVGGKLKPKYQGPYKVSKVKQHDRYEVEKIGFHEGPITTSTAADHMKPWSTSI